ncbi:low affinity immunoglobulin epsilon Fc receptor isoform X2 [Dasypus novemcinctus]|uniref:low affinity immunoglobulin epsilon Fc receptor isoform X2 n=1 Tax=Dasypus novemcinctus TaxID=9361 RepID=UPI00265DED6C|nr:low affinity immunoglobulin epsilon Fc receptor isoform X2 [Dasypus novemcinctus]
MEEHPYADVETLPRKPCCRQGTRLMLLGLLTTALWAVLLTLLLLWHWDTAKNLKQLHETAFRNVSRVSKSLEREKNDRLAQKSQAAQMAQNLARIQAEQNRMENQEAELSRNLDELQTDLSNFKSKSLNERRTDKDSLDRLQEEVMRLQIELRELNARAPGTTPGEVLPLILSTLSTLPTSVPTTVVPLSLSSTPGSMCSTCPENWVNFQRKCYYFGEGAKTWIQAKYTCSDLQGRLVSIHSAEEQDFLTKHSSWKGSWIGLRDLDIEGEFIWMDGSPVDYSNWRPGEPNNGGLGEDCVIMLGSGQWNDGFCRSEQSGWVCDRLATC